MRNAAFVCGLLLVFGASGLAGQRAAGQQPVQRHPGRHHRDTTGVKLNAGMPVGEQQLNTVSAPVSGAPVGERRRRHNAGSTSEPDLGVVQGPGSRGAQGKIVRGGNVGKWERAGNRNATVSRPISGPAQGGAIQPDYTRYKKGQGTVSAPAPISRHGPVGGASPGRPSGLGGVTVNQPPNAMVHGGWAPKVVKGGPTARRMPRPPHPRRDSLQVP